MENNAATRPETSARIKKPAPQACANLGDKISLVPGSQQWLVLAHGCTLP